MHHTGDMGQIEICLKGLTRAPGDLTCFEDCPDMCVQNRGKWVLFGPKVREWRDPLNGCQISQAPLYGYALQYVHIRGS